MGTRRKKPSTCGRKWGRSKAERGKSACRDAREGDCVHGGGGELAYPVIWRTDSVVTGRGP